jgi:hypothetical protein
MQYPCSYLTNFISTGKYDVKAVYGYFVTLPGWGDVKVDTIQDKNITIVKDTIDGWGNVTTPLGTYPCLREKRIEYISDSIWARSNDWNLWAPITAYLPKFGKDTITTYSWWSTGISVPIIKVWVDKYGIPKRTTFLKANPYIGINEISVSNFNLNIYPNPANSEITISSNLNQDVNFELYDIAGSLIKKEMIIGQNQKINVEGLSNGMYIYSLKDINGTPLKNGKLSIVK